MNTKYCANKIFANLEKYSFLFFSLLLLISTNNLYAQYCVELSNGILVNNQTYQFDINIKSTGGSFELTSYQCVLSFNQAIKNGGTLSFSYVSCSSELSNLPTNAVGVLIDNSTDRLCFASSVGSDIISTTYKKIGRFRIQNTTGFSSVSINLSWNFTGNFITILTGSGYSDITVPENFSGMDDSMPVELENFKVELEKDYIHLKWETKIEVNIWGFEIQKLFLSNSNDLSWGKIGFIDGNGNSNSPKYYNFNDTKIEKSGIYKYRLRMIDLDGSYNYSDEIEVNIKQPNNFNLQQNYPNPFNPATKIRYSIQNESLVNLTIYNSLGELIETLVNNQQSAGNYEVIWNASNLASGIYFYRMETTGIDGKDNFKAINKMQLLK